jgi:hypothetical protein
VDALRAAPLRDWEAFMARPPAAFETELKTLYVAVTRARSRLWLFEGPLPAAAGAAPPPPAYTGAATSFFAFLQRAYLVQPVYAKASADACPPFVTG